jgi:hypothetical protein
MRDRFLRERSDPSPDAVAHACLGLTETLRFADHPDCAWEELVGTEVLIVEQRRFVTTRMTRMCIDGSAPERYHRALCGEARASIEAWHPNEFQTIEALDERLCALGDQYRCDLRDYNRCRARGSGGCQAITEDVHRCHSVREEHAFRASLGLPPDDDLA